MEYYCKMHDNNWFSFSGEKIKPMLIEPQILILYTRLRFEKGNWVREKVIKKLKIVEFDISFTINISYCYPSGFRWYNQVFYFRWFALIIGCFFFLLVCVAHWRLSSLLSKLIKFRENMPQHDLRERINRETGIF